MSDILHTLEDIIGYPASRVTDKSVMFKCPFAETRHEAGEDNSPSFSYNTEENYYYCFSCKSSGSISKLKHDLNSDTNIEEIQKNTKRKSVLDKKADNELPLDKSIYLSIFFDPWKHDLAKNYLMSRGVSQQTSTKLGLGYDAYREIITFPIFDESSNLYGFQGRRIVEGDFGKILTYVTKLKNKFMGLQFYQPKLPFLLVEGLFGYARLHEIGADKYFNILAIMGSSLTNEKIEVLKQFKNHIYIMPDNDEAGHACLYQKGKKKLKQNIEDLTQTHKVHLPKWPKNKKDPDQLTIDEVKEIRYTTDSLESAIQFKLF